MYHEPFTSITSQNLILTYFNNNNLLNNILTVNSKIQNSVLGSEQTFSIDADFG